MYDPPASCLYLCDDIVEKKDKLWEKETKEKELVSWSMSSTSRFHFISAASRTFFCSCTAWSLNANDDTSSLSLELTLFCTCVQAISLYYHWQLWYYFLSVADSFTGTDTKLAFVVSNSRTLMLHALSAFCERVSFPSLEAGQLTWPFRAPFPLCRLMN